MKCRSQMSYEICRTFNTINSRTVLSKIFDYLLDKFPCYELLMFSVDCIHGVPVFGNLDRSTVTWIPFEDGKNVNRRGIEVDVMEIIDLSAESSRQLLQLLSSSDLLLSNTTH